MLLHFLMVRFLFALYWEYCQKDNVLILTKENFEEDNLRKKLLAPIGAKCAKGGKELG